MKPLLYTIGIICCFILGFTACKKDDSPSSSPDGQRMLLIGNSFFKWYAENLDVVAMDAGYDDHNSTDCISGR